MNRIVQVDNFQNMACVCANFEEFVDELAEWGVDHAAGIDFDDPELDIPALDRYFGSFGCTPQNPHPTSRFFNDHVQIIHY